VFGRRREQREKGAWVALEQEEEKEEILKAVAVPTP
jgi:hypothetical protein